MSKKILLVEDETTLSTIISETLSDEGFEVECAVDGEAGLAAFRRGGADLIIADVMMPRLDGFSMARAIRACDSEVPLIFLSARSAVNDIVEGFDIGADDYLKKPFRMRELIARVNAQLRRRHPEKAPVKPIEIGKYFFDTTGNRLIFEDIVTELTHIEAQLLRCLATRRGETVTSSELMESIWHHDDYYNRNSLHGFIHKLRRHLRRDPAICIINLRGIGYRLVVY